MIAFHAVLRELQKRIVLTNKMSKTIHFCYENQPASQESQLSKKLPYGLNSSIETGAAQNFIVKIFIFVIDWYKVALKITLS